MKKKKMIFLTTFYIYHKSDTTLIFFQNDLLTLEFGSNMGIADLNTMVEGDSKFIMKSLKEGGLSLG